MKKSIYWITETAALLALLIALQWAGSQIPVPGIKQLVTGSFVNCVLLVAALLVGKSSGLVIALVSPVFAFLLKIAPGMILSVPLIALANVSYILLVSLIAGKTGKPLWRQPVALAAGSVVKFGVLYLLGVKLFGGILFNTLSGQTLLGMELMSQKVLKQMTGAFSVTQLITALIGGTVALLIVPVLRKAIRKA